MKTDREHLTEEQIAVYAEALSSGTESILLEKWHKHMSECEQCSHEARMVSQIINEETKVLDDNYQNKHKPFPSRKYITRFATAASIVLIIGLGIVFAIDFTGNNNENLPNYNTSLPVANTSEKKDYSTGTQDSLQMQVNKDNSSSNKPDNIETNPKHQKSIPNNFRLAYVPHKELEQLTARFKDTIMRGENVSGVLPHEIEVEQGSELRIRMNNPKNTPLILDFFNNKGKKLFEKETSQEAYQVKELTEPGLYYWKLLNQDFDLIYCGKIIIEERN